MTLRSAPCIDGACDSCPRGLTCRCECHDYIDHGIEQLQTLLVWTEPATPAASDSQPRRAIRPRRSKTLGTAPAAREAWAAAVGVVIGILAATFVHIVTLVAGA